MEDSGGDEEGEGGGRTEEEREREIKVMSGSKWELQDSGRWRRIGDQPGEVEIMKNEPKSRSKNFV